MHFLSAPLELRAGQRYRFRLIDTAHAAEVLARLVSGSGTVR